MHRVCSQKFPFLMSFGKCCVLLQVFDLARNKAEPLSTQKVVSKAALTRIAFNAHHPIILVGDDKYESSLSSIMHSSVRLCMLPTTRHMLWMCHNTSCAGACPDPWR